MKVRKLLISVLVLCLALGVMVLSASAAEIETFGDCGNNVIWALDDEGVLYILGEGEMWDDFPEWYNFTDQISYVVIGEGVTSIGSYAFAECRNLLEAEIPDSVTRIGTSAFRGCESLEYIALPDNVEFIGAYAFAECTSLTSVDIPYEVQHINSCTFTGCTSLTEVSLSNNVLSIGAFAFENCAGLTDFVIPDSVTSIDGYAFCGCENLTSIVIPVGVTNIVNGTFSECRSLTEIVIPDTVTSIGNYAFNGCGSITDIIIPDGVTNIGQGAFDNCSSLTNIVIPDGVERIKDWTFYKCYNLTDVVLPDGVTSIGATAFGGCSNLTEIVIPNGVTSIGADAFFGCSNLTEIVIPDSVTSIGEYAFSWCPNLVSIKISAEINSIGDCAFIGCEDLKTIIFMGDAPKFGKDVFKRTAEYNCVTADAYYPADNRTWVASKRQDYGGEITWKKMQSLKITTQPKTVYVKNGVKTNVSIKATGEELKYTWYVKNTGESKYIESSITEPTYSVTMSSKTKDRRVYCIVTDDFGNTVKSNTVYLRMAASITTQPKTTYAKSGAKATVTVKAMGDGLKYTWYVKNKGASKYTKSSVTKSTYSVAMSSKTKDRQVYCVVTDKYGKTVQSNTVVLRMAASITTQPKTTYTKNGSTAKVTVKASGDGLKYAWYVKNKGASKYTKSSVTKSTYSVAMSSKTKDRQVYCVVTDKYGKKVQSNTVVLRMAASITTQPKTVTVKKNATAKVTVKAAGDGLKYTWYVKNKGASKFTKSSGTTATYSVKMTDTVKNRQVYCVVTDKYGKTVKSSTVTLKMK